MPLEGVLDEKHLGPSSPRLAIGPCIALYCSFHMPSMAIDYIKFSCAV